MPYLTDVLVCDIVLDSTLTSMAIRRYKMKYVSFEVEDSSNSTIIAGACWRDDCINQPTDTMETFFACYDPSGQYSDSKLERMDSPTDLMDSFAKWLRGHYDAVFVIDQDGYNYLTHIWAEDMILMRNFECIVNIGGSSVIKDAEEYANLNGINALHEEILDTYGSIMYRVATEALVYRHLVSALNYRFQYAHALQQLVTTGSESLLGPLFPTTHL